MLGLGSGCLSDVAWQEGMALWHCLSLPAWSSLVESVEHSTIGTPPSPAKVTKKTMALKCEYYNYIIRGVNRYRFLETDCKFINKALKTHEILTFVPTWKRIRPSLNDQQSTQISHYVSTE